MGCLIVLLLGAIVLFIWGPTLLVLGLAAKIWDAIKPPFIWLWENGTTISILIMGVMLIGAIIRWYIDREGMDSSFQARPRGVNDPEERRLWWLAEQEAKVLVSKLERKEGKRISGAERKEVTRRLFQEMKDQGK
jgi:hypothetical protein